MTAPELQAIDRQQRRFSWLSVAAMAVSVVHMIAAMKFFSDGSALGNLAAVALTALFDGATWVIVNYKDYAKRRNKKRSWLVSCLLWFALIISFGLNIMYMTAYMPPITKIPQWQSYLVAFAVSAFIPMCIAVAGLARGELEDDRTLLVQPEVAATLRAPELAQPDPQPTQLDAPQFATRVLSVRNRPSSMTGRRKLPQPVAMDAATSKVDSRASEWLRRKQDGESYQAISDSLGGSPRRQYISDECRKLRASQESNHD